MSVTRVLICDDHAVVRAGIRLILQNQTDFEIVGEVADGEEAIAQAGRLRPDIAILDLNMPGLNGLETIPRVLKASPDTKILVLTIHENENYYLKAIQAGVAGYVLKGVSAADLLAALRLVAQGGIAVPQGLEHRLLVDLLEGTKSGFAEGHAPLSKREQKILQFIADGRSNKEIAEMCFLSIRSVERCRTSIMNKLGLQNRTELVRYAVRRGFLSGDDPNGDPTSCHNAREAYSSSA